MTVIWHQDSPDSYRDVMRNACYQSALYLDGKNTCLPAGRRAVLRSLRPQKQRIQKKDSACRPPIAQQRFLTLLPGR
jgi:hypothetical protein